MGKTSLFEAIKDGDIGKIEVLVRKKKVKIKSARHEKKTVLAWACEAGQIDMLSKLVKLGADPRLAARPGTEQPLLSFVVSLVWSKDPVGLCRAVAEIGAPLHQTDRNGSTALHVCAAMGFSPQHAEEVTRWLLAQGLNANARDVNGVTPLHSAIGGCAHSTARLLVEAGADVDAKPTEGLLAGMAPIHLCIASFYDHMADVHPDDDDYDENRNNAHTQIGSGIRLLSEAGADIGIQDAKGQTALMVARSIESFPIDLLAELEELSNRSPTST